MPFQWHRNGMVYCGRLVAQCLAHGWQLQILQDDAAVSPLAERSHAVTTSDRGPDLLDQDRSGRFEVGWRDVRIVPGQILRDLLRVQRVASTHCYQPPP